MAPAPEPPAVSISSSSRYPIRSFTAAHQLAGVEAEKRVDFAGNKQTPRPPRPPLPTPAVPFEILYSTINSFFQNEVIQSLSSSDTPPAYLVLDAIPISAVSGIQSHIKSITEHAK